MKAGVEKHFAFRDPGRTPFSSRVVDYSQPQARAFQPGPAPQQPIAPQHFRHRVELFNLFERKRDDKMPKFRYGCPISNIIAIISIYTILISTQISRKNPTDMQGMDKDNSDWAASSNIFGSIGENACWNCDDCL